MNESFKRRVIGVASSLLLGAGCAETSATDESAPEVDLASSVEALSGPAAPNNLPIVNPYGLSASYSTDGYIDLSSAFFTPQGTNGRSCASCHSPLAGWSMSAALAQLTFLATAGLDPMFNAKDADRLGADPVNTIAQRRHAYSMLLKGKFVRNQTPPANAEFEVIDAYDPFGIGNTGRFFFFRRSMPTANFRNHIVSWDGANTEGTDLHAGLARQARGNITGAQAGTAPADENVVAEIVQYEMNMSHAQLIGHGVGRLDVGGARGGPQHLSTQPLVEGRFDIFDAWIGSNNKKRAQIARGQELFNNGDANGRRCSGCHNAANDGQNVAGTFFDIGASRVEFAESDMAVYTLRNVSTGEIRQTTDGGRGWRTGRWEDLDKFKSPSLRGVSQRGEYFHNGIAHSLMDVVKHYEVALGFQFTKQQREDLVAFLSAL